MTWSELRAHEAKQRSSRTRRQFIFWTLVSGLALSIMIIAIGEGLLLYRSHRTGLTTLDTQNRQY